VADSTVTLKVGRKAPAFSLPNQDGEKITLKDHVKGKWTLLYTYPKDMTPGCTAEACSLRDARRKLSNRGIQVFGISADSPARHQKFIERDKLNFDLLSDEDHKMLEKYGSWGEKKLYGRTFMGIKRMSFLIDPEGTIRHIWTKVKTKTHADEVLEAFEGLE
jgi:peroxiredoxin Q/BCP